MNTDNPLDDISDKELLCVSPYDPDDMEEAMMSGGGDEVLVQAFERAAARDPGFEIYHDRIVDVAYELGLTVYIMSQDAAFLEGDRDKMDKAYEILSETYFCHFNTLSSFAAHMDDPDIDHDLVVPEKKPRLN